MNRIGLGALFSGGYRNHIGKQNILGPISREVVLPSLAIPEGCVLAWDMSAETGQPIVDLSGNGHDGIWRDPTPDTAGRVLLDSGAYAYQFDGVDSYAVDTDWSPLATHAQITVEMWLNGAWSDPNVTAGLVIYSEGNSLDGTPLCNIKMSWTAGQVADYIRTAENASAQEWGCGATVLDSTWHHFAMSVDRAAGSVQFYVDGVAKSKDPASVPAGTYTMNSLAIGAMYRTGTPSKFDPIKIGLVRVYSRVLTDQAEAAALKDAEAWRFATQ